MYTTATRTDVGTMEYNFKTVHINGPNPDVLLWAKKWKNKRKIVYSDNIADHVFEIKEESELFRVEPRL